MQLVGVRREDLREGALLEVRSDRAQAGQPAGGLVRFVRREADGLVVEWRDDPRELDLLPWGAPLVVKSRLPAPALAEPETEETQFDPLPVLDGMAAALAVLAVVAAIALVLVSVFFRAGGEVAP